ncbi:hypothetical protein ACSLIE_19080, partial [Pseudarthrobacter enclensis]
GTLLAPSAVVFNDLEGAKNDSYTIPTAAGFDYLVNGSIVQPGAYHGEGSVTVTAIARPGFTLSPDAITRWEYEFTQGGSVL